MAGRKGRIRGRNQIGDKIHGVPETCGVRPKPLPELLKGKIPMFTRKTMILCTVCERMKHPLTDCYSKDCIEERKLKRLRVAQFFGGKA